jgi:hypothetical protein
VLNFIANLLVVSQLTQKGKVVEFCLDRLFFQDLNKVIFLFPYGFLTQRIVCINFLTLINLNLNQLVLLVTLMSKVKFGVKKLDI